MCFLGFKLSHPKRAVSFLKRTKKKRLPFPFGSRFIYIKYEHKYSLKNLLDDGKQTPKALCFRQLVQFLNHISTQDRYYYPYQQK